MDRILHAIKLDSSLVNYTTVTSLGLRSIRIALFLSGKREG